ncbi:unnamed protein product [Closterium sp. NIES-53]
MLQCSGSGDLGLCDTSADKLSPGAIPCVFLGCVIDAPGWQFYHPASRHLFPYHLAPPPPPPLFLAPGAARGAASGGAASRGAEPGGADSKGAETGGAEPEGVEPWGAASEGAESGAIGAGGAGGAGAGGAGDAAGASVSGGTAITGPEGARARGDGAVGTGGVEGAGAGDPTESRATGSGSSGAGGAGAGGAGVGGTGARGAGVGGPGVGGAGAGGAGAQVLGTPSSTGLTPPLLCPPPDQSQPPLQPASPLPAPSPYTEQSGGLIERREPTSRPVLPICTARRVPRSRPPYFPGTHTMSLHPSFESAAASTLVAAILHPRLCPLALRFPDLLATAHSSIYQPLALSSTFGRVQPPRSLRGSRTSGMGLVLEGRGPVFLNGHGEASWVDDSVTQRSSQGYNFSLGCGSISWRSTRSSLVPSSCCEAEIYAGAMAAHELRWLTYLL